MTHNERVEEATSKAHEKVTILGLQTSKRDPHARKVSEEIAHDAVTNLASLAKRGEMPSEEELAGLFAEVFYGHGGEPGDPKMDTHNWQAARFVLAHAEGWKK